MFRRPRSFSMALLSYPLFFLAVGMVVLFLRLEDRNAWLLAVMFSGFIALANWVTPEAEPLVPVGIRRFALAYQEAFRDVLPALQAHKVTRVPVAEEVVGRDEAALSNQP